MGERRPCPPVRIDADLVRGGLWAKLSPPAAKMVVALLVHIDRAGGCWPSVATLSDLAGLGRTATYKALRELEGLGLVRTETKGGGRADGGGYKPTTRRLTVRDGELIDPSTVREGEREPSARANTTVRQGERNRPRGRTQNHNHEPRPRTHAIEPRTDGASRCGGGDGLGHVEIADLNKTGRLIDLYCRWRGCGRPTGIDADLLNFAAAAVHAATVEPRNGKPIKSRPALFVSMVHQDNWTKITHADEDEARRRLSAHLHGGSAKPRKQPYNPLA